MISMPLSLLQRKPVGRYVIISTSQGFLLKVPRRPHNENGTFFATRVVRYQHHRDYMPPPSSTSFP